MQQKQFYEGTLQQYNPTSKKRKISKKQPNIQLKQLEKEEQKQPQS